MFCNNRRYFLMLIIGFLPQTLFAQTVPFLAEPIPASAFSAYVVTLSAGALWAAPGQTQTLTLAPEIEKTYSANNATDNALEGEIFVGVQTKFYKKIQSQIGLALFAAGNIAETGDIWDDADPAFNNYTYNYRVSHTHVALKGKLLGNWGCRWTPWISASVGVGFNRAHDFSNTPTIEEAVVSSNFTTHTTTAFTYTLGLGVELPIAKDFRAGIGYEFSDWGKNQLGTALGQVNGHGLTNSHLYTNSLIVNLSYFSC